MNGDESRRDQQGKLIKRNESKIYFAARNVDEGEVHDDISLGAMFFGLIPHDRLNYVAIKTGKCPRRSFAGEEPIFECFTQYLVAQSSPLPMFHWKERLEKAPSSAEGGEQGEIAFHIDDWKSFASN